MGRKQLGAGAHAPDLTLTGLDGGRRPLLEMARERPTVFAFLKVSCPVCQMTFPFFERLSASKTHEFVAISQDHSGATASFNSRFGVTFPAMLDLAAEGYPASNAFGISHVPTAFLVSAEGVIEWVMEGFSRAQMIELGEKAGVPTFVAGEYVPEWKSG